jgi:ABC-type sugar transport system ATPase subunit
MRSSTIPKRVPSSPLTTDTLERGDVEQRAALLTVDAVAKAFGATVALRRCSLDVLPGEVHAVIGENGSGKSTLVKILSGVQLADAGRLRVGERVCRGFTSPRDALDTGIATVFQEIQLARRQSVLENIWIGSEGLLGRARAAAARRERAGEMLARLLGEPPPLDQPAGGLPLSHQQACVIARALIRDPRVLILDEATSALDVATREALFEIVRELSARGSGVIFISHRMDEIEKLGDRITVLRSGDSVATLSREQASPRELVRLMTGAEHLTEGTAPPPAAGARPRRQPVLRSVELRLRAGRRPIEVEFSAGELVGLAGLEGHGQDRFLRALRGERVASGQIVRTRADGTSVIDSPRSAARAGIAYVPRDRRIESLFPSLSTRENFGVATMRQDVQVGLVRHRRTDRRLSTYVTKLAIKLAGAGAPVTTLSGGNQQKVVMARWLAASPEVLLLNDPTRGVDLGAKRDIYAVLRELASAGVAVIMLSTEVDELVELMDRVLVFRESELFAELTREEASREALIGAFFGRERVEGDAR